MLGGELNGCAWPETEVGGEQTGEISPGGDSESMLSIPESLAKSWLLLNDEGSNWMPGCCCRGWR